MSGSEISFQKTSSPLHSAFSFPQEEILGNIPMHWEVLGANSRGTEVSTVLLNLGVATPMGSNNSFSGVAQGHRKTQIFTLQNYSYLLTTKILFCLGVKELQCSEGREPLLETTSTLASGELSDELTGICHLQQPPPAALEERRACVLRTSNRLRCPVSKRMAGHTNYSLKEVYSSQTARLQNMRVL